MTLSNLKNQYRQSPDLIEELTYKLYAIWTLLPNEISDKEPFSTLSYLDDAWSWGDRNSILECVTWLIDYYS